MLSLCDAIAARELIDDCYEQALIGFERSIRERNADRANYWLERVVHLMNELNWIDKEIIKLRAASDDKRSRP